MQLICDMDVCKFDILTRKTIEIPIRWIVK